MGPRPRRCAPNHWGPQQFFWLSARDMTLKKRSSELSSLERFNQYYRQTEHLTAKESFKRYLWNPKTNEVLGRTGAAWSKLILFYTIFYGVLAALVAICVWGFFQTLDPRMPTWRLDRSIIGTNPGLGYRPLPPDDQVESTLIWYKGTKEENYSYWKEELIKFLEVYRYPGLTPGRGQNIHNCDYDNPPKKGQVCNVDVKNWSPCIEENSFNYHKSAPCIFLKLNKIFGWVPKYYNQTSNLPENMPAQLKEHIVNVAQKHSKYLNTVWISCEGESPADIEHIGPIKYYPTQGFPGYFYPYENSEGYLSPLVAIHLERPKTGVLINIECKAWAKNIIHDRHDRIGSVHIELMID